MSKYIRLYTQGATYFFTLVAFERRKIFTKPKFLSVFRASIKEVQQDYPFEIIAWVQLPEHLHCIWRITGKDTNYSQCWAQIKRKTTRECAQFHLSMEKLIYSKVNRNEKGIFQRRFYEHQIRDEVDFIRHVDYLHYNPVKHGLVDNVADWRYSSFHRFVKNGIYPQNWGDKFDDVSLGVDVLE